MIPQFHSLAYNLGRQKWNDTFRQNCTAAELQEPKPRNKQNVHQETNGQRITCTCTGGLLAMGKK